jgi:hypothetical protein
MKRASHSGRLLTASLGRNYRATVSLLVTASRDPGTASRASDTAATWGVVAPTACRPMRPLPCSTRLRMSFELEFLELREKIKKALSDKFRLQEFPLRRNPSTRQPKCRWPYVQGANDVVDCVKADGVSAK